MKKKNKKSPPTILNDIHKIFDDTYKFSISK